jgi:hypothetical protein
VEIGELTVEANEPVVVQPQPVTEAGVLPEVIETKFRWVPITPHGAEEPRPIPVITAEIRADMDKLCNWLHDVQRVHKAMTRLRAERRSAQTETKNTES